jgi:hypothetical protein
VNVGRIVPEACLVPAAYSRISLLPSGSDHAHCRPSSPQSRNPARYPARQQRARLTARGARRWLVLHASYVTSTSGSQIAVITGPASRAELEPVIAAC